MSKGEDSDSEDATETAETESAKKRLKLCL